MNRGGLHSLCWSTYTDNQVYVIPYLQLRKHIKFLRIFLGSVRVPLLLVFYTTGHWVLVSEWPVVLQHIVLCNNLIGSLPDILVQNEPWLISWGLGYLKWSPYSRFNLASMQQEHYSQSSYVEDMIIWKWCGECTVEGKQCQISPIAHRLRAKVICPTHILFY